MSEEDRLGTEKYVFKNIKLDKNDFKDKFRYCVLCKRYLASYEQLVFHTNKLHSKELAKTRKSVDQYLFDKRNPGKHRVCIICKTNKQVWLESKRRYSQFCNKPECKAEYKQRCDKNMLKQYGTTSFLKDPRYQALLLTKRMKHSEYTWKDGSKTDYMASFEGDFLKYCETKLNLISTDIVSVPFEKLVKYYWPEDKKEHYYIPDFYMPQYDLIIEIKDGSKFPIDSKSKMRAKEREIVKSKPYNFIKIVDKKYGDFKKLLELFANGYESSEKIIIIPEFVRGKRYDYTLEEIYYDGLLNPDGIELNGFEDWEL